MALSRKAKEAIKTSLAMTLAYGIALKMGWDKPSWAAFAVAMTSLSTIGQSFNKAAMRMLGTFMAATVALSLIAFFPQDRWLLMLSLSVWIAYCTYMMGGPKWQYFWHVSAFVCVIICMAAIPGTGNAFGLAVLRAQETGLGILVYSLVSILLWPVSSQAAFEAAAGKLAASQHQLYGAARNLMRGQGNAADVQALSAQTNQAQAGFNQLLIAAESDSYEVWETRCGWRRFQRQAAGLSETLEYWKDGLTDLRALDLASLLPNLTAFGNELEVRFGQVERMLANEAPDRHPTAIDLAPDEASIEALAHFEKAALSAAAGHLRRLERLTRSIFETLCDIRGFGEPLTAAATPAPSPPRIVPDPDRIGAVVRVVVTTWLAYLGVLYVGDIPGGSTLVTMAVVFGMVLATTPQIPLTMLFVPVASSILFASVLYIFVMPRLSSFLGLGSLIFAATFIVCYLFTTPRQALGRAFGLAMFSTIAGISNQQTYSFLAVTTTTMTYALAFLILAITAYVPFSPRPERAFQRLLGRFFRSCDYLMATVAPGVQPEETNVERWRLAFHTREVSTLPAKLAAWGKFIDPGVLPGTTPQQVQAVVASLQTLGRRMQELMQLSTRPQAPFLVQALRPEMRAWHSRVRGMFRRLSSDPAVAQGEALRTRLDEIVGNLEAHIRATMESAAEGQLDAGEEENFYRLLGTYRSLSEALVGFTASAGAIDWARWREERFA